MDVLIPKLLDFLYFFMVFIAQMLVCLLILWGILWLCDKLEDFIFEKVFPRKTFRWW